MDKGLDQISESIKLLKKGGPINIRLAQPFEDLLEADVREGRAEDRTDAISRALLGFYLQSGPAAKACILEAIQSLPVAAALARLDHHDQAKKLDRRKPKSGRNDLD